MTRANIAKTTPIELVSVAAADPLFEDVFTLGESHKQTVGMLPRQAWQEYADGGRLLVAVEPGAAGPRVVGYAAFRLPRQEVALAHLVVHPKARGRGIARRLVDELSARYGDRRGIRAKCRRDYPASAMWPELGFVAQGDLKGRGAAGERLTVWWRDHGHPDLMTWAGAPASVTPAVIDANVFIDLHSETAGDHRQHTRELLLDVLAGRVELLVAPELGNEINRQADDAERRRLQAIRQSYPTIAAGAAVVEQNRAALIAELGYEPHGRQDKSDLAHVVYAASVGVPVVVTRDDVAQRKLRTAASEALGVALVSPQELVVLLDETDAAESYSPFALLGTGFQMREAATADQALIGGFLDTSAGERRADFNRRVRALAEHRTDGAHRLVFTAPTGDAVALLGTDVVAGVLDVSILRMKTFPLASTMAAQLASRLRPLAQEAGVSAIRVSDSHPHPLLVEALLADGFGPAPGGPVGLSIDAACTVAEVAAHAASAARALGDDERKALVGVLNLADSIQAQNVPAVAAAIERQLRPLRVVDATLDTWLVPIKAPWASQLFGVPWDIYGQDDHLGISVEHVYYRGGRSGETAPARVLWYVSGAGHMTVIGCSELIEVRDGTPKELHRAFRRLGVYGFNEVCAAAGRTGSVRALRVINTELFGSRVTLARLRVLAARDGQTLQLVSPMRITAKLFAKIMTEART
jgi:GNAT superfamily N-acetyltransferase